MLRLPFKLRQACIRQTYANESQADKTFYERNGKRLAQRLPSTTRQAANLCLRTGAKPSIGILCAAHQAVRDNRKYHASNGYTIRSHANDIRILHALRALYRG